VGREAIGKLATIVTYAMVINLFFVLVELFTTLYGGVPHDVEAVAYLYTGLGGHAVLTPWAWAGVWLTVVTVVPLLFPAVRRREGVLALLCVGVVAAIWIEKGLSMVVTGFIPSPLNRVTEYLPTVPEVMIALGVYGVGGFVLTMLYKLVLGVRERSAVA
jgi:hypothetical protein